MKRLTYEINIDGIADVGLNRGVTVAQAMCRLADYENTGLEPEEIDSFYIHEVLSENEALRAQQEQEKNEPLTNADRIRAMSDEDLVDIIRGTEYCPPGKDHVTCGTIGTCQGCWVDWLRQPAEGGGNDGAD